MIDFELLKQLGLQPQANIAPQPTPDDPYNYRAQQLNQQAQQLEAQAAPPPAPHGLARFGQLLSAGLEGFTGGYTHGPGYFEHEAARQAQEHQRQQDLFGRARELRGEGEKQTQLGIGVVNSANQLEELKRLRAAQESDRALKEREQKFKEDQANRPKFEHVPADTTYGAMNPETGTFTPQGTTPKATPDKNIGAYTRGDGVHMEVFQKPDGSTYERPFSDVRASAGDTREPGAYMDLRDDQGRVIGAWNPKSNEFKPIPTEVQGARRAGVSPTVNAKITDLENSYRKIMDLQTAYKPEFVGPTQGRIERSKAGGVLSYLPFLTTPEGYGEFAALNADLKNSIIKLITGAQMGVQEAQRILQQVPTEIDKPEIWTAKYEQTKKNADFLLSKTKELTGAGGVQQAAPPEQTQMPNSFIKPGGALENLLRH